MSEPNSPREAVEQHRDEYKRKVDAAVTEIENKLGPDAPRFSPLGEPDRVQSKAEYPRFKVGDVVVLRSGGPKMTVFLVRPTMHKHEGSLVDTSWFDGGELRRDSFAETEFAPAPSASGILIDKDILSALKEAKSDGIALGGTISDRIKLDQKYLALIEVAIEEIERLNSKIEHAPPKETP